MGLVLVSGGLGWPLSPGDGVSDGCPALGQVAGFSGSKFSYLGSLTGGQVEGSLITKLLGSYSSGSWGWGAVVWTSQVPWVIGKDEDRSQSLRRPSVRSKLQQTAEQKPTSAKKKDLEL